MRLFGADVHVITMPQAIATILDWLDETSCGVEPDASGMRHEELGDSWEAVAEWSEETRERATVAAPRRCRFVVTPNVDHIVLLNRHAGLREAYRDADLVIADGWPIVAASRLLGRPLPERVAGSDLVPKLFGAQRSFRVFLLGAAPGVADIAASKISAAWPSIRIVGTHSPPLGFENDDRETGCILDRLEDAGPDVLVVGLGAPKQELWVHAHAGRIAAKVALCVGGTIDFLAGHRHRAPRWVQHVGLEWLHRMLSEPRRMVPRYARDAWVFPQLVWREWRRSTCTAARDSATLLRTKSQIRNPKSQTILNDQNLNDQNRKTRSCLN